MITSRSIVEHDHQKPAKSYDDMIAELYPGSSTITVTFQVTEGCNLACTYCYQGHKTSNHMTFETAKAAMDMILTNHTYLDTSVKDAVILEFIGGEPLLEIDLIRQIYEYFLVRATELNHPWLTKHRVNICTNGVLFMDQRIQDFLEQYKYTCAIAITIDGPKELHDACRVFHDGTGSYDVVLKSVQYAAAHWNLRDTKVTIAPENVQYLEYLIKFMYEELHFNHVHANCTYEGPWTVDTARTLYEQMVKLSDYCYDNDTYSSLEVSLFSETDFTGIDVSDEDDNRNWCGGTGEMLAVDYRGIFYPCLRYMPTSLGPDVKPVEIGNLTDGLCETESDKAFFEGMKAITLMSQSEQKCIDCPIARGCSWCSAYNYQCNGTMNKRVTEICIMHKARALGSAYYWNRFYEKHHVNAVHELYLPEEDAVEIIGRQEYDELIQLINDQRSRLIS